MTVLPDYSVTYNDANVFSNLLNTNINKLYLHEFKQLQAASSARTQVTQGSNKVGDNTVP